MSFSQAQTYVGFAVNVSFLLGFGITAYQFYLGEKAAELQKKAKDLKTWLKAPRS